MLESNFSNQNPIDEKPRKGLLFSVFLGLLTFVVTPIVGTFIAIPFLFLVKISESFNPILIISGIFGLEGLGGYFAANFILGVLLALLGDFATAIISWFVNHSKKLAAVTFFSAILFQIAATAISLPEVIQQSQRITVAAIETEKYYQSFAKIGTVGFEVQEPFSDIEIDNRHPEYGHIYKKLRIVIPVSVSQAGTYQVNVRYSFSKAGETGSTPMKDATETFGVGEHTIKVEFLANEISSYGFWSPPSVGGTVDVQLSYLVSEKEVLDRISPQMDKKMGKIILKQLLKDEGMDKPEAGTKPMINKSVERKIVRFN